LKFEIYYFNEPSGCNYDGESVGEHHFVIFKKFEGPGKENERYEEK
jgi:hypothetical protein